MSQLHTHQSSYQKIRSNFVTAADATLSSYKATDRPADSECFVAGPEVGGVSVIFAGSGSDNDTFSWILYGYRAVGEGANIGPAEFICSGTGILGAAEAEIGSGYLYADTIVITDPGNWYDVPVAVDSGNNRICKICFDLCGFKYLHVRFTAIGGASMQAYVGFY